MNVSDPGAIKAAKKNAKKVRREQLNDMVTLLSLEAGRRFLYRLMMQSGLDFTIYSENPHHIFYKAGQQDLGRFFKNELEEADQEAFIQMMKEGKKWQNQQKAQQQGQEECQEPAETAQEQEQGPEPKEEQQL